MTPNIELVIQISVLILTVVILGIQIYGKAMLNSIAKEQGRIKTQLKNIDDIKTIERLKQMLKVVLNFSIKNEKVTLKDY